MSASAETAREYWSKRHLRIQQQQDKEIRKLLHDAALSVERDLRSVEAGSVREAQLQEARVAILQRLSVMWLNVGNVVRANRDLAVATAVRTSIDWDILLINETSLTLRDKENLKKSMRATAQRNVDLMLDRFTSDNIDLSSRVYRAQALSSGWVERQINLAIGKGYSWRELAASVKPMIIPNVPGGVSYAAKRLARTEINMAFHRAQVQENINKPWLNGMSWRLSASHPQPDICDKYASQNSYRLGRGVYPANQVPDPPHPQCLCFKVPKTEEPEDFLESFFNGNYDAYLSQKYGI